MPDAMGRRQRSRKCGRERRGWTPCTLASRDGSPRRAPNTVRQLSGCRIELTMKDHPVLHLELLPVVELPDAPAAFHGRCWPAPQTGG